MKKAYIHMVAMALCFTFLLGIKDGKIVLWKQGQSQPVKTYSYPLSRLPKQAQDALKEGVPLESEQQLYDMIKEYMS